jgi:predicted transcriptional regulator
MARSTGYDKDIHDDRAWALAIEGKTDIEIANALGITERTLNNWKKEHPSFFQSLKEGKEVVDGKVEKTLYERAMGYTVTDKKIIIEMDANGNQKPARIEKMERKVPADITAIIFWLKNRRPDQWREKKEISVNSFEELMKSMPDDVDE